MKSIRHLFAAVVLAGAFAIPASAQQIANTFGPGSSYPAGSFYEISTTAFWIANPFMSAVPTPLQLTSIQLPLSIAGYPADNLTIGVYEGADMNSATLLESFSFSGGPNSPASIQTFTSILNPTIDPGVQYWLALTASTNGVTNGSYRWHTSYYDETTLNMSNNSGASWFAFGTTGANAYAIEGSDLESATPEPASLLLVATGLAAMTIVRRRKRA